MSPIIAKLVKAFLMLGIIAIPIAIAAVIARNATSPAVSTVTATFTTTTGAHAFQLEIADDNEERAAGLMFRRSLGVESGMLFIFPNERRLNFWMQNTYIPLDIIFLDAELNVIKVHQQAEPLQIEEHYDSDVPAMYAVELNGGVAAEINLQVGSQLVVDLDTISDI